MKLREFLSSPFLEHTTTVNVTNEDYSIDVIAYPKELFELMPELLECEIIKLGVRDVDVYVRVSYKCDYLLIRRRVLWHTYDTRIPSPFDEITGE